MDRLDGEENDFSIALAPSYFKAVLLRYSVFKERISGEEYMTRAGS